MAIYSIESSILCFDAGFYLFEFHITSRICTNRLMNTRGNTLLLEEKERNRVNKALPRIEQELHELIEGKQK